MALREGFPDDDNQVLRSTGATPTDRFAMTSNAFRTPRRLTITIPYCTYEQLLERSDEQGRSLSNLAAYLLESALLRDRIVELDEPSRQRIGA